MGRGWEGPSRFLSDTDGVVRAVSSSAMRLAVDERVEIAGDENEDPTVLGFECGSLLIGLRRPAKGPGEESWIQHWLLGVLNNLENIYKSKAFTVDFYNTEDAKKQINSYVENNTNGKIVDVLSSVDKDTDSILVNFIQFEGNSETPFEDKSVGDFHVNKDKTVKVPFLSSTGYYNMAVLDEATLVAVPYKGGISALYILANKGKLEEVEANLEDIMKKWEERNCSNLVALSIPTISLSGCLNLKEELAKTGMTDVFSTPSGTTGDSKLNISKVLHVAKANFNEMGNIAARTTGLEISPLERPPKINVNRPFILILVTTSNLIFMGIVTNPSNSLNRCPK
ncbi:PREDICTED: alpha-1-antitrypsin-like [Nanorana parkeri]|uniref:alpha-1-antitrypsin-like n=1 Tax=Nanorana parkeri TaxID=125878 RepID=UPI000854F92F|nr:PREDICTED: alpha-1-antitrypsin-like [Nanorana parkeri]